jgi:chemotaxis protein CheD
MRYGVHSMELLINDLLKRGAMRRRFEAKLFGGASVIKNRSHIGKSNAEFAKSFLLRESIPITAEHLGGTAARRLKFSPTTGRVEHFVVPTTSDIEQPKVARAAPPPKPDVTLF